LFIINQSPEAEATDEADLCLLPKFELWNQHSSEIAKACCTEGEVFKGKSQNF
jgi:hypothetical protein